MTNPLGAELFDGARHVERKLIGLGLSGRLGVNAHLSKTKDKLVIRLYWLRQAVIPANITRQEQSSHGTHRKKTTD